MKKDKKRLFRKGDIIKDTRGYYRKCIIVDEELAIFARSLNRKGTRVSFAKLFAIQPEHKYERCLERSKWVTVGWTHGGYDFEVVSPILS